MANTVNETAIKKLTGHNALVVGPGLKTGLNIKIENPAQTGADLVVGQHSHCIGCYEEYEDGLRLVDTEYKEQKGRRW